MAADRIRLAQPAPAHCSGCFQQKPQQTHVDFGAAYDGPMVPPLEGSVGVVGHSIDDLILCADCLTAAAKLIGLDNAGALTAERDQLEASNHVLRMEATGYKDYAEKLEAAVSAMPPSRAKRQAVKR
jgi:hypothetical protein